MGIVKIVFVAALDMSLRIARYSFVRQEFGLHYESVLCERQIRSTNCEFE